MVTGTSSLVLFFATLVATGLSLMCAGAVPRSAAMATGWPTAGTVIVVLLPSSLDLCTLNSCVFCLPFVAHVIMSEGGDFDFCDLGFEFCIVNINTSPLAVYHDDEKNMSGMYFV